QEQEAARLVTDWVKANPKDMVVRTYLAERSLSEQKYESAVQQYRHRHPFAAPGREIDTAQHLHLFGPLVVGLDQTTALQHRLR
ncbi:MAG TPA: hypothetical protein PKN18_10645, partial [Pseudomonadales bacterium]|nr:hypothetical protein [Pseudomonadales bacterium]